MLELFEPIRSGIALSLPADARRPVAIVGAGEIVDVAHLPVYARHGLPVVGVFDQNRDRAAELARKHGIDRVYASLDELAKDDRVAIVDIAVYPWAQPRIATALLDAGKHLLCQKPLAYDLQQAVDLVDHAAAGNRLLAVNQQLRFAETFQAVRAMLAAGWIGEPYEIGFDFHVYTPWEAWAWVRDLPRLDLRQHTIHYLDMIRHLFGDPLRVYGSQAREPGQPEAGETRTISVLEYPGELRAWLKVFHKNRAGDPRAEFRIDGTAGSLRGTIGLMYDYPVGRPDTLEVNSRRLPTDGWVPYPVTSRWIPDAFIGPMASLQSAVAGGGEPLTSGRDHLATLRLLEALYRSGEEHQVVQLAGR